MPDCQQSVAQSKEESVGSVAVVEIVLFNLQSKTRDASGIEYNQHMITNQMDEHSGVVRFQGIADICGVVG